MKLWCQQLSVFYGSLPAILQYALLAAAAALLFMEGQWVGAPIGKALYFLLN